MLNHLNIYLICISCGIFRFVSIFLTRTLARSLSHLVLMHIWFVVHSVFFFCFNFFGVFLSGGCWLDNRCDCITSKNSTSTIKSTVNENTQRFFSRSTENRESINEKHRYAYWCLEFIHSFHSLKMHTKTSFIKREWSREKSNRIPQHCCINNDKLKLIRRHYSALLHIQFALYDLWS